MMDTVTVSGGESQLRVASMIHDRMGRHVLWKTPHTHSADVIHLGSVALDTFFDLARPHVGNILANERTLLVPSLDLTLDILLCVDPPEQHFFEETRERIVRSAWAAGHTYAINHVVPRRSGHDEIMCLRPTGQRGDPLVIHHLHADQSASLELPYLHRPVRFNGNFEHESISCAQPSLWFIRTLYRIQMEIEGRLCSDNQRDFDLHRQRTHAQIFLLRLFVRLFDELRARAIPSVLQLEELTAALPPGYPSLEHFQQVIGSWRIRDMAEGATTWQLTLQGDQSDPQELFDRNLRTLHAALDWLRMAVEMTHQLPPHQAALPSGGDPTPNPAFHASRRQQQP